MVLRKRPRECQERKERDEIEVKSNEENDKTISKRETDVRKQIMK